MEKKMGEHTFASVVVTHLLSKGKRRLQDRKMFGRPQPRWDSRLVEPLIERFAIPDHQYYLLDCALGFQSRKSNSDRFQTEDEIVLIPFGAIGSSVIPSRNQGWRRQCFAVAVTVPSWDGEVVGDELKTTLCWMAPGWRIKRAVPNSRSVPNACSRSIPPHQSNVFRDTLSARLDASFVFTDAS
jgi:hypothetical protein